MSPEWRTIIYQRLPCMENYPLATEREREEPVSQQPVATKTVSRSPSPHVMFDPLWWSDMAADCDDWRHLIFKAVNEFQEDLRDAQKDVKHLWTLHMVLPFQHCSPRP